MRRRDILLAVLGLLVLLLVFAWIDGGREEERMIVEPIALPENFS